MSEKIKLGCSITQEEKELLDRLTKKLKKSQGDLIGLLLRSYENISPKGLASRHDRQPVISLEAFNLSSQEQREVENALTNSDSQIDEVARDGLQRAIALPKQYCR